MKNYKSIRLRFHILQSVFWCAYCTLTTYVMAWFLELGMSHTYASLILAAELGVSFLLLYGLTCLIAFLMPSVRKKRSGNGKRPLTEKPQISVKALTKNRIYLNLLVIIFLADLGTSPINSTKITLYQNVGRNISFLGIDSLFSS